MVSYDMVLKNAKIYDGSGNPWYSADIAIAQGKIAGIGSIPADAGRECLDVAGRAVTPGFIDSHCHADFALFDDPLAGNKIKQGITTQVIGNCGISAAPVRDKYLELLQLYVSFTTAGVKPAWDWRGFGEYLDRLEAMNCGINIAAYVGHGSVRLAVMGMDDRPASAEEIRAMRALVVAAMQDGAWGMSSGLIYPPGVYSDTAEMIALCEVVAEYGGVYATHMRSEGDDVLDSIRETIEVAKKTGVSAIVSHHKIAGRNNWGASVATLRLIDEARADGVEIVCDQYPYLAGNTTLSAILPPWAQAGGVAKMIDNLNNPELRQKIADEILSDRGGWESLFARCGAEGIYIMYAPARPEAEGKNLIEIAVLLRKEPVDAALDLIVEQGGAAAALFFSMCEEDVQRIMRHPAVIIGSDSIPVAPQVKPHPRVNGTFPRVLGKYAREEKVLTLEDAVRKMTSLPARSLGLPGKGLLAVGMDADLVVFDPETVADRATYGDPTAEPVGIEHVFIAGVPVLTAGQLTGRRVGKILRRVG